MFMKMFMKMYGKCNISALNNLIHKVIENDVGKRGQAELNHLPRKIG